MKRRTRILIVQPREEVTRRVVSRLRREGHDVVAVESAAEAQAAHGCFDRGLFEFDLDDGSGIVLAAKLKLAGRVHEVAFFHPHEAPDPDEELSASRGDRAFDGPPGDHAAQTA